MAEPLKILSWNILHGGGTRISEIVNSLVEHEPDVVALQEFRHNKNKNILIDALADMGLTCVSTSEPDDAKGNGLLIASRYPIQADLFPEGQKPAHCLSAEIDVGGSVVVKLLAVHFPQKKAQVPLFEALLDLSFDWKDGCSLLIGDFNCGIPWVDSDTKTFYATGYFQQLLRDGWTDAWRSRWPDAREFSWVSARKGNGFRYDHTLVSSVLDRDVMRVFYDHSVRERKISDHSLMILEVDL